MSAPEGQPPLVTLPPMKHRTTDPACVRHRPPTGWFSRWRFDRGRSCRACYAERVMADLCARTGWELAP